MITFVLVVHVVLAVLSLGLAGGVVYSGFRRQPETTKKRVRQMWISTISTLVTGIFLTVISNAPIGSSCMSLLSLLVVIALAHGYQRWALAPSRVSQ